jgi:glycosyltransferase involved in cell wall biosynthesis
MRNTLALAIPAYNAEKLLPRLLTSAAHQSVPFDEIWVYNDCSVDQTASVAEAYGARVLNGQVNRGCSFGKNRLAAASSCQWIHFHDADDDLLPGFVALVKNWMDRFGPDYQVLLLNFNYIDSESGNLLGTGGHQRDALRQDPLRYAILHKIVNFGIYQRTAFLEAGGFDIDDDVLYNEDNALHQQLARAGLKFDYLPEVTCINYRYAVSMSVSNRRACARATYHVLAKTARTHGSTYPTELAAQLWHSATGLAAVLDWVYVDKCLELACRLAPDYRPGGGLFFQLALCVGPRFAYRFREYSIRLFKPDLRK